jgi:hypothetical protein
LLGNQFIQPNTIVKPVAANWKSADSLSRKK